MQLMHNGEGLYCLRTPFPVQAKSLFNLPPQEKKNIYQIWNPKKKKLQAAVHQAAVHQDLPKRRDQNRRP